VGGIFILIVAAFVWMVYFFVWPYYQSWKIGRDWQAVENELTNYFKSDTYGGATPQETYEMYVAALKRGDIESASRYFYFQKEDAQKAKLQDLATKGELQKYIDDLPEWVEMREEEYDANNTRQFSYGSLSLQIIFGLNGYANIWKIETL